MTLRMVLDQHARNFTYLLITKCVLQTRIDQVAHHLLSVLLVGKTLDQVQTEVLRKWDFDNRFNRFSLWYLLGLGLLLGLLRSLVLVLGVRGLSPFSLLNLLRFLLFSTAKNLVSELIDLLHELLLGSLFSLSIKINFAHPELDVNWIVTKNTCLMKVPDRILTATDALEKNTS